MTRKLFGTDGIRGTANIEPMTAETALKVAMATAVQFHRGDHRHLAVIGKDTRLSGYMLEPALTAGLIAMGMDVVLVGPMPTPAVAMLTRSLRADLGIMISASHNPFQDNGIKLFGPDGYKLSDEVEAEIEGRLTDPLGSSLVKPAALGRASRLEDASGRYIEFVKNTFPRGLRLDGLKIVVDCAHGAAYKVAPKVLWELGAEVVMLSGDNQATADRIADALVGEGLAACVTLLPGAQSVYRWEGRVERGEEVQLLIKTSRAAFAALRERLCALHPYEVPELVACDLVDGLPAYLDWIVRGTAGPAS